MTDPTKFYLSDSFCSAVQNGAATPSVPFGVDSSTTASTSSTYNDPYSYNYTLDAPADLTITNAALAGMQKAQEENQQNQDSSQSSTTNKQLPSPMDIAGQG